MNRHNIFKAVVVTATVCMLLPAGKSVLAQETRELPNIVLILADDMRLGEPSHAGGIIPTPALDRMAKEGMRFTDAHTSSSVCTPTRYGILTGRYNWRSRLKSAVLFNATDRALMDSQRLNLPHFLQKAAIACRLLYVGPAMSQRAARVMSQSARLTSSPRSLKSWAGTTTFLTRPPRTRFRSIPA